jgi:hypothetical protein
MRGRSLQRSILAAIAATTLLALIASSSAAASPAGEHHSAKVTTTNPDADQCDIPGTEVETFMANVTDLPNGTRRFEFWDRWIFTSALTRKSIESFAAEQMTTNVDPIDDGDGTVSLIFHFTGLEQRLKLPNGEVLARDVGPITFTLTLDANGDFVSFTASGEKGPHPLFDSGGYCNVLIPALS